MEITLLIIKYEDLLYKKEETIKAIISFLLIIVVLMLI